MTAYLQTQRSWLTVERLPATRRPQPDELVWGNVKGRELANLCADNLVRSSGRSAEASGAFAEHPRWRSRFSAMRAFLLDCLVTVLRETQ